MEVLKVEAKEFKVYSQDIESLRMEKTWGTLCFLNNSRLQRAGWRTRGDDLVRTGCWNNPLRWIRI